MNIEAYVFAAGSLQRYEKKSEMQHFMIRQYDNDPTLGQVYRGTGARGKKKPPASVRKNAPKTENELKEQLKDSVSLSALKAVQDSATYAAHPLAGSTVTITPENTIVIAPKDQAATVSYNTDQQGIVVFPEVNGEESPFSTPNGVTIDPFEPNNNIRKTAYTEPPEEKEWTILCYMAGDNDLEPYLVSNLVALEKVGSTKKINIVAELDRGESPRSPVSKWKGSRRFLVKQSDDPRRVASPAVQDLGNVNMADPSHLTDFIKWGIKNYPAKHYMLIINDHGYGFMGAAEDRGNKHTMPLPDTGKALQEGGHKFDIIGFDACLMSQAEVAYELKDSAKIMIASQETIGSAGWPYGDFKDAEIIKQKGPVESPPVSLSTPSASKRRAKYEEYLQSSNLGISAFITKAEKIIRKQGELTPEIFAHGIVSQCEKHTEATPTMAAIRLGEYMDMVVDSMKAMAGAIQQSEEKGELLAIIQQTQGFNLVAPEQHPYGDYRDAWDFCDRILKSDTITDANLKAAAKDVHKALDLAILDAIQGSAAPAKYRDASGLSLYLPDTMGDTDFGYAQTQFDKKTGWLDAMRAIACHETGVCWSPLYEPPQLKTKKNEQQGLT